MRRLMMCAVLGATVVGPGHAQPDVSGAARLVADLGLREAATPVRESPGWRRPHRIVVLFGGPDDIATLRTVAPDVEFLAPTSFGEARAAIATADAYIGPCSGGLLQSAPRLTWVQVLSAGVEGCVDAPLFRERGVLLTNMQRVSGAVMAEHVLALTFAHARRLPAYVQAQAQGEWTRGAMFSDGPPAITLTGRRMLVVGFGGVGSEIAKRAAALGLTVDAIRNSRGDAPPHVQRMGVLSDLPAWIRDADVIVDALPLTEETRGVFNARVFDAAKPGAFFVNVGRGGTVVTDDLVRALRSGKLSGAGLDVVDPEPLPSGHPLWSVPGVIITPHVSADSEDENAVKWQVARENLRRYLAGERMLSVVDVARGY